MKVQEIHLKEPLPFDSPETQRSYQLGKIKLLEEELSELNLLEHPCEILALCKQIIALKEQLPKVTPQVK